MSKEVSPLLLIQIEGSAVIVESNNSDTKELIKQQALAKGAQCQEITIDDYIAQYRGYRYFDLRNPVTRDSFDLDKIIEILSAPLDDHIDEDGNFIFH